MIDVKFIKLIMAVVAVVNVVYITSFVMDSNGRSLFFSNKLPDFPSGNTSNAIGIPETTTLEDQKDTLPPIEKPTVQPKKLYELPAVPYDQLSDRDKILYKLNEVTKNKEEYWLAHTEMSDSVLEIRIEDFKKHNWADKPALFHDPRFTLSIYLNEIKNQYLTKNPKNEKFKIHEITVPFSWSDWVDITYLNREIKKPESSRVNCEYLKSTHHVPAKDPNYCIDYTDITEEDLKEMGLPSTKFLPGFAIKQSPANKATNEVRMLEGKTHLLTYATNPLAIIFLSKDGVYESKINDQKQRIVDSDLFENYLKNNKIDDKAEKLVLDPVKEFQDFTRKIKPNPLDPEDDEYGMVGKIKETDPRVSRELYLPAAAFDYRQDKIDAQIKSYDERMAKLFELTTNELVFDHDTINRERLSRNEQLYYQSLKYANKFDPKKELTYFRMSRLKFETDDPIKDGGWHYEWRFFNGALRYQKDDWNEDELLIREKILLDRILRNWFRFANEKGIISWIAHGPLLSWFWDGLLFPFDEDIDIQMPAEELTRFSKLYNQTLVIEDITEGFGKYLIDCSTFIHHRTKTENENHIDARFIDIDTGSYIDITGLGISTDPAPDKYKEIIEKAEAEGNPKPVYNCRNAHFYSYDELSPLKFTMMGGVPLYVPHKITELLNDEYSTGMTAYSYNGFYFVDAINLWIHQLKLAFLFEEQDYLNEEQKIDTEKFTQLIQQIDDSKVLKLLESDRDILLEYYLTKDVTELHKKELTYLFELPDGEKTLIGNVGAEKPHSEVSANEEYHRLTSQFKFQNPFRRPLFNYEHIDRPKHHHEYNNRA